MIIRRAVYSDIEEINNLLRQVLEVHHKGRPDLFKGGVKKYNDQQLKEIIDDDNCPVFVAVEDDIVLGYAFCIIKQAVNDNILTDIKTLYIDDLCVDEKCRGMHIGKGLYKFILDYAKGIGCYNVTLNVWALNDSAMKFYESCGLKPQKIGMEKIL